MKKLIVFPAACIATLICQLCQSAASAEQPASAVKIDPLRNAYYGDLHLHTSYSFDAYFGGTGVSPDEAYRFARGDVVNYLGQPVQRRDALDFMAVTDHSENLGVFSALGDPNSPISRSDVGKLFKSLQAGHAEDRDEPSHLERFYTFWWDYFIGSKNRLPNNLKPVSAAAWEREIEAANRHYIPGKFTTFIAYEWTAMPNGANLHRNVIFKGDRAPSPFTSFESKYPEDLWEWLDTIRRQGFEALAIPHNANASNGVMYDWVKSDSLPLTRAYAQARQTNEPLSEIAQVKGASETHPLLSPNDEFADYEIMDYVALWRGREGRVQGSYLRDALSLGLVLERQLGVNPYKYGFVGASDLHGGLTVSAQADFGGGHGGLNIDGARPTKAAAKRALEYPQLTSGNMTGVWAESNTREAIYDALLRREVFATSGTKLKLRFFGGWGFDEKLLQQKNWIATAYAKGVPMGGDLPAKPAVADSPSFAIWAVKDSNGGNLDRLQIIKVWEENGQQQEKIFDVAWSGDRKADGHTARLPAIGDTVDMKTGRFTNSIGAAELKAVWKDPEFKSNQLAAYYLRVLEIPTPRWSTLLALQNELPLPENIPGTVQQRGWSSPIWSSAK